MLVPKWSFPSLSVVFGSAFRRAILVIALIVTLPGCGRSPAGQIESVLNSCAAVSKQVSGKQANPAEIAEFVADSFQAMDVSRCPQDFRIAFQQHVIAWRQEQFACAKYSANNAAGAAADGVSQNSGMGSPMAEVEKANQEINATYNTLTTVAAKYGARIPRSVIE